MASANMERLLGGGLTFVLTAYLIWKIWHSIRSGVVHISLSSNPQNTLLDISAERASLPTIYWILVGSLVLSALVVGTVFLMLVGGVIH